jgi:hypothetical protein
MGMFEEPVMLSWREYSLEWWFSSSVWRCQGPLIGLSGTAERSQHPSSFSSSGFISGSIVGKISLGKKRSREGDKNLLWDVFQGLFSF